MQNVLYEMDATCKIETQFHISCVVPLLTQRYEAGNSDMAYSFSLNSAQCKGA